MMDTEIIWERVQSCRVSFSFREMQTKLTVGGDLSNKNFGVAPFRTKIDCAGNSFAKGHITEHVLEPRPNSDISCE